ncbi:hypothetical protein COM13_24290 [Bacillus pseudomycoides]|uniref:Uncharacterized protein n=1 Tax=Bacillus pseudomycoides TaxID=64104 RepID=A0ABD6TGZ7_9BACI|nr:hypothetical protein bmyco0003_10030 [Bacillus pseudomycoides]PDX99905.1 hypothetical protein COO07_14690 [Bacillus pseudomycoides]PDZ72912.1 hypothetical protein CON58_15005 [Bacillus pseudomycoides]PEK82135.1 hypothetical protein CN597_03405 [Bacillus pseudomycoides]PEN09810.1 hypothetical protein CN640_10155 [Bacillus pseudomycoides]
MLNNPGFDDGTTGGVTGWNSSGATVVDISGPDNNSHSGILVTGPAPGQAVTKIQAVRLDPGDSINQPVSVDPGCCYTLSFAADVRANAIPVAAVSFPGLGQSCTPTISELTSGIIPHIVPNNNQPQSSFQHFTLVVCVPSGAIQACISFQNILPSQGVGGAAFIDNVVFQPTGGGCDPDSCEQNF